MKLNADLLTLDFVKALANQLVDAYSNRQNVGDVRAALADLGYLGPIGGGADREVAEGDRARLWSELWLTGQAGDPTIRLEWLAPYRGQGDLLVLVHTPRYKVETLAY